jgi:hypothetical protein
MTAVSSVYVMGSLTRRGPDGFVSDRSDVDLLLVLAESCHTPGGRVKACRDLLPFVLSLEQKLSNLIGRRCEADTEILSVLVLTPFELHSAIHPTANDFLTKVRVLDPKHPDAKPFALPEAGTHPLGPGFAGPMASIKLAIKRRKLFMAVNSQGRRAIEEPEDPGHRIGKVLGQAAARLQAFLLGSEERPDVAYNVHQGRLYLRQLAYELPPQGEELDEILARVPPVPEDGSDWAIEDSPELQIFLGEILVDKAQELIVTAQDERWLDQREYLHVVSKGDPLYLGSLNLRCQLFPAELWHGDRKRHLFKDVVEPSDRRIELRRFDAKLPTGLLTTLVEEVYAEMRSLDPSSGDDVRRRHEELSFVQGKLSLGSQPYPRLVGLPWLERWQQGPEVDLVVPIAESYYGVALVEEKKIDMPTARQLRRTYVLNSLAVRVLLLHTVDGQLHAEFHRRKGHYNATYASAWDVGAAGYIDSLLHVDPESAGRVSPWVAARAELREELNLRNEMLPYREGFFFLGIGRNTPTGQVDVLGYCRSGMPIPLNREPTKGVSEYGRCIFDPRNVARFVAAKRKWVPTALLTLILCLEALGHSREEIETAFGDIEAIDLDP